jgi:hypothetical protein
VKVTSAKVSEGGSLVSCGALVETVDGVVALAMALDRAEHKPEPVRLLGWLGV